MKGEGWWTWAQRAVAGLIAAVLLAVAWRNGLGEVTLFNLLGLLGFMASIALAFVGHYRPSRVELARFTPAQYSLWGSDGYTVLRLPVVIVNRGARTGVLIDARLKCPWFDEALEMNEFYETLGAEPHGGGVFAHPVAVPGGGSHLVFASFKIETPITSPEVEIGTYTFKVKIRTDRQPSWTPAWEFEIEVDGRAKEELVGSTHWNPVERGQVGT